MKNIISFCDIKFHDLTESHAEQMFSLRRRAFNHRLKWGGRCINKKGIDQFDSVNAVYLAGFYKDTMICSTRLIDTRHPSMITGVFYKYFKDITLPEGHLIEASQFFVDKRRKQEFHINNIPVSSMHFLSLINYAMLNRYKGIVTMVNKKMFTILRRSGWEPQVINKSTSKEIETLYLIFLPTDKHSRNNFIMKLVRYPFVRGQMIYEWPLEFTVRGTGMCTSGNSQFS